jgi:predicted nucleic acid-binding protein
MIRVFLDANVLYSAAASPNGINRAIFRVAEIRGDVTLLATRYVEGEAEINLMDRALWQERANLKALIANQVEVCSSPPFELTQRLAPLVPDPADAPVLAGAVFAEAHWLVTANSKDFGDLYGTMVESVLVLRPREAYDHLTLNFSGGA